MASCFALSAQMFTRFPNELQFYQADPGQAVWFDYDNDGWLDVLCAGGWKGGYGNRMFHNNQDGTFTQLNEAGFAGQGDHCFSATLADFNEDGFLDIFGSNFVDPGTTDQYPVLYLNRSGTGFTKRLLDRSATLGGTEARGGGTILDFDHDGWVDVALARGAVPSQNYLLRNTGSGVFAAIQNTAWTTDAIGYEYLSSMDYDGDREPDLLGLGNPPRLFRNPGNGEFERVTDSLLTSHQNAMSLSSAWGDFDNDGDIDVAVSYINQASIDLQLFLNDGNGNFAPGFSTPHLCQYAYAVDYDNDGLLDLFVTGFNSRCRLYRNLGAGEFEEILDEPIAQDSFAQFPTAGWGDFDNDGFLDLLVTAAGSTNQLYRSSSNGNHWLKVRLRGGVSNRAAIGAVVRVKATIHGQEVWQMRVVQAQSNFTEIEPTFGLGDATTIDLLRIEWPSGNVTELADVAVDQILLVTEPGTILPARPSASLGGSIQLTSRTGRDVQWYHEGVLLEGETNRTLTLTNVQETDAGRYSIVIATTTGFSTNFTYVYVDTQFSKVAGEPWDTDLGTSNVAVGDYDGDDDLDVFVGRYRSGRSALYRNNGDGTFQSLTNSTFPLAIGDYWFGPCGDFDNDGRTDVFALRPDGISPSLFFYGHGDGTFAPMPLATISPWWQHSIDYDHDGLLDLYLTSWGAGQTNRLYRNLGDRDFQILTRDDVGAILGPRSFGNAALADYDDDGWEDVAMPDITSGRCRLYRNLGTGRFEAVTNQVTQASLPSALVASWADYDNDDRLDLFVAGGASALYRNLGGGDFERVAFQAPVQGFYNGATWGDYDNDGFLDLFMTYGNGQGNDLFRNNGDGSFTTITRGSIVNDNVTPDASYASLWFDYDNDGFLDLLVPNGNDAGTAVVPNFLYHNNGNSNAWLKIKLVGTTSNREGAGAKVRVLATIAGASRWQRRDITSGGDPYSGNGPIAHFGLGDATVVTRLQIEWPSGTVQQSRSVATNQFLTIVEPRRPVMSGVITLEGSFQIEFTTESDRTYQLQGSDDLMSWAIVETFTGTGEPMVWTEVPAGLRRFYRVVSP